MMCNERHIRSADPIDRRDRAAEEDEEPMSAAADDETPERSADPRLRLLVAGLVAVEAVLIVAGTVALVVETAISDRGRIGPALFLAAVLVVIGVTLGACARAILQGLRWTRGPVVTWQLLQSGVSLPLSTTRLWWVGVLIVGRHVITQTNDRF
jgi:hypothetical protein